MVAATRHQPLSVPDAAARRRSIRAYAGDPVPRADLEEILRVTSLAPSAFNLQPWRFVVVESAERKAKLWAAARRQRQVEAAPLVIVLYTDTAAALAEAERVIQPGLPEEQRARKLASIARAFETKTVAEREAWGAAQGYIALGYLLLAAESFGYQTSPMLGFDAEAVKAALDLPPHVRVPALVALGRGAETGEPHHRLPVSDLVTLR
jgi:nitroreductase